MPRPAFFRLWQAAVVATTVMVVVWALVVHSPLYAEHSLFFAALVLIATFLRTEAGEESIGFEAAIAFGAIILFHDPAIAVVSVFAGGLAHDLTVAARARRISLSRLYVTSHLALSYWIVALLYASAVDRNAPAMAKVSGFILLLIGYLVARLLFASLRRWFEGDGGPIDFRAFAFVEARTLLLVTPIVAIEVMLFNAYGMAGFAIAFLPVLLIAYAMRNELDAQRQNGELNRRNRELALLTESATQILAAEGDEETLRRLMGILSKLARMKACAVVTWEMNADVPGTVYRFGECLPTDQDVLRWVDSAGFAQSAPSRAFVFQNDLRRFPLSSGSAIQVLIGIQTVEVIYGILIFETEETSILKTGSLNLLTLLVNQTAISLQDQLLRREMREKTQLLEAQAVTMNTILATSNSLIGSFDVDGNLTRIAQAIRTSLGFETVVFALYDTKRAAFFRRAHAGLDAVWDEMRRKPVPVSEITAFCNPEFSVSNSYFVSHTALRQSDGEFFVFPEEDESSLMAEEWHVNDILLVPLMSAGETIGYLSVRDPSDRHVPSIEKVRTLEIFAVQAVTALQSAGQYDEIKRLTTIDALTPAFNHRYFQEALGKEIHRHSRTSHEFALAMIDIDNFKRCNDTFGHPIGDEILKGLVEELMNNARDSDIVSRYGGEEFAIIFADTPASSARDAANRLRELIERREMRMPGIGRTLRITVSIGVAIYPHDGTNSADLVSRADAALYFAKKNGKNQVAMATDVPDVGVGAGA
jgi:diguanylate cyclase (GGDEF)-like protein